MDGSVHAARKSLALSFAGPARYSVLANTSPEYTGSNPCSRNSITPASNSSRAKALAGATMATRSPARRARGFRSGSKTRHFRRDGLVLVAAEKRPEGPAVERARPRRRQKPLLHPAMARQCILDPCQRDRAVLDRVDDGLQRLELGRLRVAAHQHGITAGGERADRGLRGGVTRADRFHPDVVGEDDSL